MKRGRSRPPSLATFKPHVDLPSHLLRAFSEHPLGLCGQHDPARVVSDVGDPEQRLNILALGVVLDINLLTPERWSGLVGLAGHWLLDPPNAAYRSSQQVMAAMREKDILGPAHIPRVWWQLCRGVQGRFKGSWRDLLAAGQDDAQILQRYLRRNRATFPILAGPVISARWLDLVHRIGGITLLNWETLGIPLPSGQKKTARLFGIKEDEVHPLLFSALYTWSGACRKLPEESCGFGDCPRT